MSEAISQYVDQERLYNTEGRRGVENLCQIVGAIGYEDPNHYGQERVNSDGRLYSPRAVAENHILADLGRIPTVEQYFKNMTIQPWMSGTLKKHRKQPFNKGEEA